MSKKNKKAKKADDYIPDDFEDWGYDPDLDIPTGEAYWDDQNVITIERYRDGDSCFSVNSHPTPTVNKDWYIDCGIFFIRLRSMEIYGRWPYLSLTPADFGRRRVDGDEYRIGNKKVNLRHEIGFAEVDSVGDYYVSRMLNDPNHPKYLEFHRAFNNLFDEIVGGIVHPLDYVGKDEHENSKEG